MKRKNLNLLLVLALITTMLVGCGDSGQTSAVNEIGATEKEDVSEKENEILSEVAQVNDEETETTPESSEEVEPVEETSEETEPEKSEEQKPSEESKPEEPETPAHTHSYTMTLKREYGCGTPNSLPGIELYTCSCGDSYEEYVSLGCVSDGVRVNYVEAMFPCTEETITCEHCVNCGTAINMEKIPPCGCVPSGNWIYNEGIRFQTCKYCGVSCLKENVE